MIKRKIRKYLNSIKEVKYKNLDSILYLYLNQDIKSQLEEYGFTKVEIYVRVKKNRNEFIINMFLSNMFIDIQFHDEEYDYVIYNRGITPEELDKNIVNKVYPFDFDYIKFIQFIHETVQNDVRFRRGETF